MAIANELMIIAQPKQAVSRSRSSNADPSLGLKVLTPDDTEPLKRGLVTDSRVGLVSRSRGTNDVGLSVGLRVELVTQESGRAQVGKWVCFAQNGRGVVDLSLFTLHALAPHCENSSHLADQNLSWPWRGRV
jgi:hypothetical protein